MDKLERMMEAQRAFAQGFADLRSLDAVGRDEWLRDTAVCMAAEAMELLAETNWKHWKARRPLDVDAAREEVADITCFLLNAAAILGMDADGLCEAHLAKVAKNHERQRNGYGKRAEKAGGAV